MTEVKKTAKKMGIALGIILLALLGWWIISLIKCEVSTLLHRDVIGAYENDADAAYFVAGYDRAKVLEYSSKEAKVYYINEWNDEWGEGAVGTVVTYVKVDGEWLTYSCDTMWSSRGNADRVVWPYLNHYIDYFVN